MPCQDCAAARVIDAGGEPALVATCADGAGSAKYADVGSRLACEEVTHQIIGALEGGLRVDQIDRERVLDWHRQTLAALESEAERRGCTSRDLACTLLVAVVGEAAAAFSQIGDGAIVALMDGEYRPVFWPQTGEYVNTTNFLTDGRCESVLEFCSHAGSLDALALLTDGLQSLALDHAEKRAHPPFFAPLFRFLRDAPHSDELTDRLRRFLGSERVNQRTDDDKTLILATRCPPHDTSQAI
jgi:hypothetical protein